MWTRVIARVGQEKASVSADLFGSPPIAATVEWHAPLDLNTQIAITDRYDIETTYSVAGVEACAGLFHLSLSLSPLPLVAHDKDGEPVAVQPAVQPAAPASKPSPVATEDDPEQPDEEVQQ